MPKAAFTTTAAVAAAALLALGSSASAAAPAQKLPPGVYPAERDFRLAPAGAYELDSKHAAVIARVSHLGYSYSVFRFDQVVGDLTWNPAAATKSALKVTVKTGSIATNVEGFAPELAGDHFLKSKEFPEATFVSTGFRKIDATHGKVDGKFTLMGKTVPMTFDVELVGAGKGFMGHPRIGVHARAKLKPQDFNLTLPGSDPVELVIDTEFSKTS